MPADLHIRTATPADIAAIVAFQCAMADETEGMHLDEAVVTRGVERLLREPALGFYLVAERNGAPAASLMVTAEWSDWRNGLFWWIQSVYVRPEHRRQGLYRALYAHVRELAAEHPDVCGFRLYVERENTAAQQTYRSLGMEETPYRLYEEVLVR